MKIKPLLLLVEENIFQKHAAAAALNLEDETDKSPNSDNIFPSGTINFSQKTYELLCGPHMA